MKCPLERIEQLKQYLSKYQWLADFYAIDFLVSDFYDTIPNDWKILETVDYDTLFRIVKSGKIDPTWPASLQLFINESHTLPIDRKCYMEPLELLKDIALGMNEKKVKETSLISKVVDRAAKDSGATHVLDFGCGQGYLSTVLAFQLGYHVIGIDADIKQTTGGEQRSNRINRLLEHHGFKVEGSLRFISQRINVDDGLDSILEMVEQTFPDLVGSRWIICGLHTCGNLATTMIRGIAITSNSNILGLVSVGCCYQLLTEQDPSDSCTQNQDTRVGFPMSKAVAPLHLGLNTRIVACSASQRWTPTSSIQDSLRRLYYRAVFQKLMVDGGITPPVVSHNEALESNGGERAIRKLSKTAASDPVSYVTAALERLGCVQTIHSGTVIATYEWYEYARKQIAVVWTLRGLLGDAIESLVLMDRVWFLKEQGIDVQLVSVVDPGESPRNMALVVKRS